MIPLESLSESPLTTPPTCRLGIQSSFFKASRVGPSTRRRLDLLERHVLGQVVAHAYVIEFQKRGLPHAHILLINHPEDRITPENVDDAVQATIPTEEEDKILYDMNSIRIS